MNVLGVDPGYVNCGFSVACMPERRLLHASGEFLTRDRWLWGSRIDSILTDLHARFGLDAVCMEEPQVIHEAGATARRRGRKTTVSPDSTIGLWGTGLLIHDWCRRRGMQVFTPLPPLALKRQAAALAGAQRDWKKDPTKAEMIGFVKTIYGVELENDHAADAALAAAVGYHSVHARSRPA